MDTPHESECESCKREETNYQFVGFSQNKNTNAIKKLNLKEEIEDRAKYQEYWARYLIKKKKDEKDQKKQQDKMQSKAFLVAHDNYFSNLPFAQKRRNTFIDYNNKKE